MLENNSAPFTFVKDGVFYFTRRVPKDLHPHYTSRKISFSLRTRSAWVARSRAVRAAQQLDEHWYFLRSQHCHLPGKHMLRFADQGEWLGQRYHQQASATGHDSACLLLSEAVATYLSLKGNGRGLTFRRAAERSCGYLVDVCGDKAITGYTRKDANAFRDELIERGLAGSSITRVFGTVRSVINFAAAEEGITLTNPFAGVYYDRKAGVTERSSLPVEALRTVQCLCRDLDDELRWLVALVSDTGMRLAEAAGLSLDDLRLDGPVPHVVVQEHPWRRLKTAGSRRVVPLVGASLWAAGRLRVRHAGQTMAFPRYNRTGTTNANSASAALNKWLRDHAPDGCTMHSFRHSMRDRLRAVECPADVVDQIGGWQTEGVGHSYGQGYPLAVLQRWMQGIL